MDLVFDINVLVSALIGKGKPRELWLKAVRKEFNLILSRKILSEFIGVISRKKFQRYVEEIDVIDFLKALSTTAKFVRAKPRIKVVKEDPDDDVVLATAHDGHADYIVSGDRHLLKLKTFRGIHVITVDQALRILKHKT